MGEAKICKGCGVAVEKKERRRRLCDKCRTDRKRAYDKAWYLRNAEKMRAYGRAYGKTYGKKKYDDGSH